jgi:hypothetical protein
MYSRLLVIRWRSSGRSRPQQEIKALYPSIYRILCAVLISVIFCSSVADRWSEINWRFWSNPLLIVPNTPIITGTVFVLTFRILLTSVSWSSFLLSFSVSLVLPFESSGMATSISRQVFSVLSCSTTSGRFASTVRSVITDTSHVTVVPLTVMTLSSICSQY